MRVKVDRIFNYLLFIIFTFATLVFFHNYALFLFFAILAMLPIASILFTHYASRHIGVHITEQLYTTIKNKESFIRIEITNPFPFPFSSFQLTYQRSNLFYPNQETDSLSFPIYAKGKQFITVPISSYYSGTVNVLFQAFTLWDLFRFFSIKIPLNLSVDLIVTPNMELPVLLDETIGTYGEEDVKENQNKGDDPTEVKNIREYRMGDRPQSIHWKLSSKRDSLLVKEHESLSSHQQILLFELYKDDSFLLDPILDLTYSLSLHLVKTRVEWKLMWWSEANNDFKEASVHSEEDLWHVFNELFYEATYTSPSYAYELFRQRETRTRDYIYVAKSNPGIYGKEIARIGNEVTALMVME